MIKINSSLKWRNKIGKSGNEPKMSPGENFLAHFDQKDEVIGNWTTVWRHECLKVLQWVCVLSGPKCRQAEKQVIFVEFILEVWSRGMGNYRSQEKQIGIKDKKLRRFVAWLDIFSEKTDQYPQLVMRYPFIKNEVDIITDLLSPLIVWNLI